MLAGASAVQVGTAFFTNPYVIDDIVAGLDQYLEKEQIASVSELTGKAILW